MDVNQRKFDVDYGHSFYIADDIRSFALASSDNVSCMDAGEIGAHLGELETAASQISHSKGDSDLKICPKLEYCLGFLRWDGR